MQSWRSVRRARPASDGIIGVRLSVTRPGSGRHPASSSPIAMNVTSGGADTSTSVTPAATSRPERGRRQHRPRREKHVARRRLLPFAADVASRAAGCPAHRSGASPFARCTDGVLRAQTVSVPGGTARPVATGRASPGASGSAGGTLPASTGLADTPRPFARRSPSRPSRSCRTAGARCAAAHVRGQCRARPHGRQARSARASARPRPAAPRPRGHAPWGHATAPRSRRSARPPPPPAAGRVRRRCRRRRS